MIVLNQSIFSLEKARGLSRPRAFILGDFSAIIGGVDWQTGYQQSVHLRGGDLVRQEPKDGFE